MGAAVWTVTVSDGQGAKRIKVSASDRGDAMLKAGRHGRPLRAERERRGFLSAPAMTEGERALFLERLSTLAASHVGMSKALTAMRDTLPGRPGAAAGRLLDAVSAGMDVGEAMQANPADFPPAVAAIVKAGMESGSTERALREAADFEKALGDARSHGGGGMAGAVLGILFAAAVTVGLDRVMSDMLAGLPMMQGAKSPDYELYMRLCSLASVGLAWLSGFMLAATLGLWALATAGRRLFPQAADTAIARVPVYRDVVLSLRNFIAAYQLGLLCRSGIPIEAALTLTAAGTPKGRLKADLEAAARAVRGGLPWADRLSLLHPTGWPFRQRRTGRGRRTRSTPWRGGSGRSTSAGSTPWCRSCGGSPSRSSPSRWSSWASRPRYRSARSSCSRARCDAVRKANGM